MTISTISCKALAILESSLPSSDCCGKKNDIYKTKIRLARGQWNIPRKKRKHDGKKTTSRVNNFSDFSMSEGKPLILNSLTNVSSRMDRSTLAHMLLTALSRTWKKPNTHEDSNKKIKRVNRGYTSFSLLQPIIFI